LVPFPLKLIATSVLSSIIAESASGVDPCSAKSGSGGGPRLAIIQAAEAHNEVRHRYFQHKNNK
jgi:hypothetical protein